PETIRHTYIMFTISIVVYLLGAHISSNYIISLISMVASLVFAFCIMKTQAPIFLVCMAFCVGLTNNQFFEYINLIDPSIIKEALWVTTVIFIGLSYLAY